MCFLAPCCRHVFKLFGVTGRGISYHMKVWKVGHPGPLGVLGTVFSHIFYMISNNCHHL